MNRRDVLKGIVAAAGSTGVAQLLGACMSDEPLLSEEAQELTNTRLLGTTATRTTWTNIVSGRWSSSIYDGLLMYDRTAGYLALYDTDGQGHLSANPISAGTTSSTWTHVASVRIDDSGYSSILFYDSASKNVCLYSTDGLGNLTLHSQWATNKSYTHVTAGYFTAENYSSILFYDKQTGGSELWATTNSQSRKPYRIATDLIGSGPSSVSGAIKVVSGFFDTANSGAETPLQGLLLYWSSGNAQWFSPDSFHFSSLGSQTLPSGYSLISAGNLGGLGFTDLLTTSSTGTFVETLDQFDSPPSWHRAEDITGIVPAITDLSVTGHFWLSNPDDQCFHDGPKDNIPGDALRERRNWRASAGPFLDLAFYERNSGTLSIFSHLPTPRSLRSNIEGYVTSVSNHGGTAIPTGSVLPGETVSIHISSTTSYSLHIYDVTDSAQTSLYSYNGLANGPLSISNTAFRDGAGWPVTTTYTVPSSPATGSASGMYIVKISNGTDTVLVPFVVREATPAASTKILVVVPDVNDEAYNMWGGRSLYVNETNLNSIATAWPNGVRVPWALKVNFDRPYINPVDNAGGTQPDSKWIFHISPLLNWLKSFGLNYAVITNRDLDFSAISPSYRLVIFPGHHEYWTLNMRNHTETFTSQGGNVAFMCANTCYWQVRLSSDYNSIYCFRHSGFDPLLNIDNSRVTVLWSESPVNRPQARMTGLSYFGQTLADQAGHATALWQFTYNGAAVAEWLNDQTSLGAGSLFGTCNYGSIVGTEVDAIDTSLSDVNFVRLAHLDLSSIGYSAEAADLGYWKPSNTSGIVFNAGCIDWTLGLTTDAKHLAANWLPMDQITLNVVTGLRGAPKSMPGSVLDIAVGSGGQAWCTTSTQGIQKWNSTSSAWEMVSGTALRIAVDSSGNPWVINGASEIYRWSGSGFQRVAGAAFDIGSGGGWVWVIGTDYRPYYWSGTQFVGIDGSGVKIAVDATGSPWLVNAAGNVYRRIGGVGAGGSWQQIGLQCASDIGIGANGSVWIAGASSVTNGHPIFQVYSGDSTIWPRFGRIPLAGINVSVGPDGRPWVANDQHALYTFA